MIRAGDIVICLLAAALIGAVFGWTWLPDAPAAYAVVRVPGEPARRVPLSENRRLEVPGRLGESVLVIRSGQARFLHSPCPGQYCVHRGWLDSAGDFAACLPNGVSLTLIEGEARFDAIAF